VLEPSPLSPRASLAVSGRLELELYADRAGSFYAVAVHREPAAGPRLLLHEPSTPASTGRAA
jgi:hypothetical protein